MVNGNGKPAADDETRHFDDDTHKNWALRLYQALGDYGGIGGYYYAGKEAMQEGDVSATNKVTYWGADFNLAGGPFDLTFQYLFREDSDPILQEEARDVKTDGVVVELVCARDRMMSRNYLTLLYNNIDSQLETLDYETLTASYTYLLARNVRLTAEWTNSFITHKNRLVLGIVTGF